MKEKHFGGFRRVLSCSMALLICLPLWAFPVFAEDAGYFAPESPDAQGAPEAQGGWVAEVRSDEDGAPQSAAEPVEGQGDGLSQEPGGAPGLEEGEGTVVDGQSGGEAGSPGATDGDGGTTDGAITEEGGSDRPDEAVSSGAIDAGATSDGAISADATTDGAVTAEATSEAAIAAAVFTFISLSVDDSLRYYDNNGDPVEFEVVLNDEASGLSYSVFLGAAPVRLKIPEGVYSVERGVFAPLGYKVAQISPQHFAVSNGVCYIDGEIVGSIEISVDYELSGKRYFAIERSCYYIMMTRGGSERRRAAEINTEPTAEEGATSAPESDATPEPATPEQPEPTGGEAAAADGGTDGAEPDVGAGGTAAPAGPPAPASPTAPEGGVKPIPISAVPPNARHIEDLYQKLLSHDYP